MTHPNDYIDRTKNNELKYENGKLYTSIAESPKMKCYKCDKETKRLIPIYEYADNMAVFNYKILFYCRQCFYYYLHGVLE